MKKKEVSIIEENKSLFLSQQQQQQQNFISIDAAYNQLSGSIPTELGLLSDLKRISMGFNSISGSLPSHIGMLDELEWVDFRKFYFLFFFETLSLVSRFLPHPLPD